MRINKLFIYLTFLFFTTSTLFSDEIEFEASNMDIKNDGNTIIAYNSKTIILNENITITSKKAKYIKDKKIIIFEDDVFFDDKKNKLTIQSQKISYDKDKDLIYSNNETFFDIENKYKIKSNDVFFNRKINEIYSDKATTLKDDKKNIYNFKKKFKYDLNDRIVKSNNSIIEDIDGNKYNFDNLVVNLKNNEIIGTGLDVEYEDSYFGNKNNDPILKGNSAYSNKDELRIYKGVFSTCNKENKKCRGWELNTQEFSHNKNKKIFEYRHSWLKLFGYKILYFPYFNHPDPTVKRKSGFLTPSYSSSENLGTSVNIPYFKVLGTDRDMTFNPRYYADKSFMLQSEYRQALKNSDVISDFSFLIGDEGTKSHFFYNQVGNFNQRTSYELNLQDVKGDNYLKRHQLNLTSPIITNENVLSSNFNINWNWIDADLDASVKIYEDLSKDNHDRYQYIFPDFSFRKAVPIPEKYNGSFNFYSSGYNKNYNTNINETVINNDFLFESNSYISNIGIASNYNLLLKNTNNHTNNSTEFSNHKNYDVFGTFKYDMSLPLQSRNEVYTNYLTPRMSLRYSPNGNNDISSKDIKLNYNNAFSLNRIRSDSQVEGDEALTIGLEFQKEKDVIGNVLEFRIGNVLKAKNSNNLPKKSKLNETRSDIFGDLNFKINEFLTFGYGFSYDRDLKHSNLDTFNLGISVNNFITNFNYYSESHDFGDSENISNSTTYNFSKEHILRFNTAENLRDNFTPYYTIEYEYLTDCLSINFNYNKTFYSDGNLEPDQTLSFLIKIIPFTELGVENVGTIINN